MAAPRTRDYGRYGTPIAPNGRILVTGGAGFVGSNLCVELARKGLASEVVALDSLVRRGSELNLPRLRDVGVRFLHGDVRDPADLARAGAVDAIVECSAEPSVLAGVQGDVDHLVRTNLFGAFHCLELARRHDAQLVFLSTSRVYPVGHLRALALREEDTRLVLLDRQSGEGASARGITEGFPLDGHRSLYGATKLGAEHLVAEYAATFGVRAVVNRCGVIAGPWQFGKADQGVFTWWVLCHHIGRPLRYVGYNGKQVRDVLHVGDLIGLICEQLLSPSQWAGVVVNVGGGVEMSLSLRETTALCEELTGRRLYIGTDPQVRPADVPVYISDCARLFTHTDWRPQKDPRATLADILDWVVANSATLERTL